MNRKILLCLLCVLIIFIVGGCSIKKEDVKLKSEKEIIQYVSKKYGKNTYISKETSDKSIKYKFKDQEYSFEYECTSSILQLCLDASCADRYYESTSCNFDERYKRFLADTLNLNHDDDTSGNSQSFRLKYNSEEEARAKVPEAAKRIKQMDTRNYFANLVIGICHNNYCLDEYDINSNKYESHNPW